MEEATTPGAPRPLTLHDLSEAIMGLLEATDGEITPEVELQLAELTPLLGMKVEAYAAVCARLEAEEEALRKLAARYTERARLKASASDRLRERVRDAMERMGESKIKTATVTASLKVNPASLELLVPEDKVPLEYIELVPKVLTKKIAEALKAGTALEWAQMKAKSTHVQFR